MKKKRHKNDVTECLRMDFIALDEEIIEKEIKFNTAQNTDK